MSWRLGDQGYVCVYFQQKKVDGPTLFYIKLNLSTHLKFATLHGCNFWTKTTPYFVLLFWLYCKLPECSTGSRNQEEGSKEQGGCSNSWNKCQAAAQVIVSCTLEHTRLGYPNVENCTSSSEVHSTVLIILNYC